MTIDYIDEQLDADLKKGFKYWRKECKTPEKKSPTLCCILVCKYVKLNHWNQRTVLW